MDERCSHLFSKYWNECHFWMGDLLYVYCEKDLPDEAWYQKGRLMRFINNLGYIRGCVLYRRLKINT